VILRATYLRIINISIVVLVCTSFMMISEVFSQPRQIRFIPSFVEVMEDGEEFTVACVVEDVIGLLGGDIQIAWNTTYLDYVTHTATVPVEIYPPPNSPSPYGGIIHSPIWMLKDEVDTLGPGTYWWAFATLGGSFFSGNGTAFIITFRSKNVSLGDPTYYIDIYLNITQSDLAAAGMPINHNTIDGIVRIPEFHPLIVPVVIVTTLMVTLIKRRIRARL
jgi:hypothetical protein